MPIHQKKRKYEMGRQSSNTKLGEKKVVLIRCRGGNVKQRALKINEGNFNWISEKIARKSKILEILLFERASKNSSEGPWEKKIQK